MIMAIAAAMPCLRKLSLILEEYVPVPRAAFVALSSLVSLEELEVRYIEAGWIPQDDLQDIAALLKPLPHLRDVEIGLENYCHSANAPPAMAVVIPRPACWSSSSSDDDDNDDDDDDELSSTEAHTSPAP
jgi:hypothetical protein